MDHRTGKLILEARMGGGVFAFQQPQRGKDAGGGADGGHLLARLGEGGAGVGDGLVGGKVRGTGDAAGQHDQIHIRIIHLFGQCIGGQMNFMAADQLFAAHGRRHDDLDLGAAKKIDDEKGLALLGAVGEKDNCFAHTAILLFQSDKKHRRAGASRPRGARSCGYSSVAASAFSSSRRRSTLSSLLMTRLTRLMMALDAPMLPMMLV